jgi:hypothetical protein
VWRLTTARFFGRTTAVNVKLLLPPRQSRGASLDRLETAGVEFLDENGGGPGVRLRKRQLKKG